MLPNYDNSTAYPAASTLSFPPAAEPLITAAVDLDVQISDLLAQRVAIEAEQVRGANLVAPRRRQRGGEQRHLDFLEDAVVESRRRYPVGETRKVRRQIGFHRAAEIVDAMVD